MRLGKIILIKVKVPTYKIIGLLFNLKRLELKLL